MPNEYLTPKEVAQALKLNIKTVHKLLLEKEIPCWRHGKLIRIPANALDKLMKS